MDDLAGLVQEQDKQLGPRVEARDVPGAEETVPVSEEPTKEVPNEGALATPGKHCYQAGDMVTGLVRYINAHGAYLDHGDMTVLIPAEGKDTPLFRVGDSITAEVKRVEEDGTVILDTYLVLEEDEEDSSSTDQRDGAEGVYLCGRFGRKRGQQGYGLQNSEAGGWCQIPANVAGYGCSFQCICTCATIFWKP